ncbi:TPA: LamG domain-containing protein [Candidatus Poribacteria bacterium]|nr:LamG domain-containing protein [Candidatus Poribacteria bacterium]HIA71037.1 LamG domain-containing protein [Candidatus Poribacteria bacterium]HIC03144.1 LamG domain-containing protein [Candidatus Poribacteria bacterium]
MAEKITKFRTKWHHIVGTYDGKTKRVYLDGALLNEQGEKFKFAGTNDKDLRLGCSKDRPQYTHDGGMIDEAAVWRRALSPDEIKMVMKGDMLAVFPEDILAITWGSIKIR